MELSAGSPAISDGSPSCRSSAQPEACPRSPLAKGLEPDSSPRSPLALNAAHSPRSNPLQHVIVTDSPPHRQLQAGAACNSTPRGAPPAFLQPLAAVVQRCVDLNAAACPSVRRRCSSGSALDPVPALRQVGGSTAAAAPQQSLFHGLRAPPISIAAYVERIAKYAKCSPVCFVMAVTYMERAAEGNAALQPDPLSVHRLLLTGVLLAAKLMDDRYYSNAYYAKIGGVALHELNSLELAMMQQLGWQLRVGALPVTRALAQINASAGASDAQLAARFGALLRPAALTAIDAAATAAAAAAVATLDVSAADAAEQAAVDGVDCRAAAAAAVAAAEWCPTQQWRRSSLDCRVAACVTPFVSSSIAAH